MNYIILKSIQSNGRLAAEIIEKTKFLDELSNKVPFRQRLWHLSYNIFTPVLCNSCDNTVKWAEKSKGYRTFCSTKCSANSRAVRDQTENTCLKKYGHTTNLKTDETKEKIKQTNVEKYGVDNPFKSTKIKEKIKQTNLERYGVENPALSKEVVAKIDQTHFYKYGKKRQSQSHLADSIINLKNNRDIMYDWHVNKKMPLTEIADTLNVNHSQLCTHFKTNLKIPVRRHNTSILEAQVCEYLDELGITYVCSDRNILRPKEIDILIPSLNIGIEIDGLAWHTELRGKTRNYHLDKTQMAKEHGIRLIHIFSNEWIFNPDIVKSRLASFMQKNERIYARKCTTKSLSNVEMSQFFTESHIQGNAPASVGIGLFYNDILVAAISFSKARYNKRFQWELIRYANALNINVVGGASKLFTHFIRTYGPESVITYSDKRWNTGKLYEKLGFVYDHSSGPNYFYTNNYAKLEPRIKFQKHKLKNILESFDPDQTEWENMQAHGYDRIWDCGNDVFFWNKNG